MEAPDWSSLLGGALTNAGSIFDMLAPALRLGGSYYAGQRSAVRMEEAARSYRELGREAFTEVTLAVELFRAVGHEG